MKRLWLPVTLAALTIGGYALWLSLSAPQYGWLVFGPQGATRMLLRAGDEHVSIDLNRNGRFEAAERIEFGSPVGLSIPVSDALAQYVITSVGSYEHEHNRNRRNITLTVEVRGTPQFRQSGDLSLSTRRAGAPIAHFNGPLEIQAQTMLWELPKNLTLARGDKGTDIRANIGTIRKTDRCWTVVYTQTGTNAFFPTNVFPWVEVEFPSKAGGAPILARFPLDKVC